MQVILLERVTGLGGMGDTVTVKPGYARNFLIPQDKALPATKANLEKFENRRKELEAENKAKQSDAQSLADKMEGTSISLKRQASETGMLYGTIRPRDIVEELSGKGFDVPRSAVNIGDPIRELGEYTVKLALHPDVIVSLPVQVERQSA